MGVLGWAAFGTAVRLWQLGIEMRPFFQQKTAIGYPIFASIGGAFGYWLDGVEKRQAEILEVRKRSLLEKRERHAKREASEAGEGAGAVAW